MAFNSSYKLNKSNFSNIDRLNKFTDKLNVKNILFIKILLSQISI